MTTLATKLRRLAVAGRSMLTALRAAPMEVEQAVDHEYNDLLAAVMEAELAGRDDARDERGTRSR